jgi:hypothetical protein
MSGEVLRALAEDGPQALWVAGCFAAPVLVRTLYLGIAMVAAMKARDQANREACYRIFHDLIELFRRGGEK